MFVQRNQGKLFIGYRYHIKRISSAYRRQRLPILEWLDSRADTWHKDRTTPVIRVCTTIGKRVMT